MEAEWSVAAGEDDPVVVVPWSDDAGDSVYVDLRLNAALIDQIPEARAWPAMRAALLTLNRQGSPVWSAKCDVWELSDDEKQLDFGPVSCGFGAYIDIFRSKTTPFSSLLEWMGEMKRLAASAGELSPVLARVEFVLRPANCFGSEAIYSLTVYVYGYGEDAASANENWSLALRNIVGLFVDSR